MAPRGGGGTSGSSGGGRASGSSSSGSGGSSSSVSSSKGGSSYGLIPGPVTGTPRGSSSVSGSKGGSSSGPSSKGGSSSSNGSKGSGSKGSGSKGGSSSGPGSKGGSSSSNGSKGSGSKGSGSKGWKGPKGYKGGKPYHGSSGSYVSAAIPSKNNPFSFLNLGPGRESLVKHNTDIVASIDQQYLNGSQHRVGLSQAMPGSTTLQGCQMDRTLPSLCQCRGNEDYTSVYVALGLIFLIFFVLTVLAEYIFAKMFPKLRAPAESEDTAEKGTATSKTVTIAVGVKMHPLEAAGAEKLPLADSSLPEATDGQWEREGNDD